MGHESGVIAISLDSINGHHYPTYTNYHQNDM